MWTTFIRKFVTKNFQKSPNLVTLDTGLMSVTHGNVLYVTVKSIFFGLEMCVIFWSVDIEALEINLFWIPCHHKSCFAQPQYRLLPLTVAFSFWSKVPQQTPEPVELLDGHKSENCQLNQVKSLINLSAVLPDVKIKVSKYFQIGVLTVCAQQWRFKKQSNKLSTILAT